MIPSVEQAIVVHKLASQKTSWHAITWNNTWISQLPEMLWSTSLFALTTLFGGNHFFDTFQLQHIQNQKLVEAL